ncbi:MAG: class I SAM-dependent methyltransferase [Phycisphaeraceae bacterium]|nr:class I SAM-dependent methyltransferase [Phycisphaeraceae bacterium]
METASHTSLHDMNPTGRFSDRANDYAAFRPDYPAPAWDAVLEGLDRVRLTIADVGAGTGISTVQLADAVTGQSRVLAVEPNDAMRRAIPAHRRIEPVNATAEKLPVERGSLDLIVCAQAFHWFVPEPTLAEFARVLRPSGRVALLWNERDDSDPLTATYGAAIRAASGNHPAEKRADHFTFLRDSGLFVGYRVRVFPHAQRLPGVRGLIGRAASASYVPASGPEREAMERTLAEAARHHADERGDVVLRYETIVHVAERR